MMKIIISCIPKATIGREVLIRDSNLYLTPKVAKSLLLISFILSTGCDHVNWRVIIFSYVVVYLVYQVSNY